ncbi:MAG: type II secretion system protein GspM [Desulfopila sp.]
MTAGITSMIQWYDNRPLRERILLLACIAVVVLYLAHQFMLQPLDEKRRAARQEIDALQLEQKEIAAQKMIVEGYKNADPDRQNRRRLEVLEREAEKLHKELEAGIDSLIAPSHMPELLKELLTREEQLDLLLLQNQQPERIVLGDAKPGDDQEVEVVQPVVYRHPLHMKFSGDYLALLHYLRELEDLPRAMVWEEVDIATGAYPQATVELKVYTLSLMEGWIGG